MNHYIMKVQIEEVQLFDLTVLTDEELAALLEVTVDQLLGASEP